MKIFPRDRTFGSDRRCRVRVALSLPVYLLRDTDIHPVESKTINVSSEGFYCLVGQPFSPGEALTCVISVPACDQEDPEYFISLECHSRVLRIERVDDDAYGMACCIEDYKVIPRIGRNPLLEINQMLSLD